MDIPYPIPSEPSRHCVGQSRDLITLSREAIGRSKDKIVRLKLNAPDPAIRTSASAARLLPAVACPRGSRR
jgi:hypothetical protein